MVQALARSRDRAPVIGWLKEFWSPIAHVKGTTSANFEITFRKDWTKHLNELETERATETLWSEFKAPTTKKPITRESEIQRLAKAIAKDASDGILGTSPDSVSTFLHEIQAQVSALLAEARDLEAKATVEADARSGAEAKAVNAQWVHEDDLSAPEPAPKKQSTRKQKATVCKEENADDAIGDLLRAA